MKLQALESAILFASTAHEGQWREGSEPQPYITHPLDVLDKLQAIGGIQDETILVAAVLHDTLEECEVTYSEILDRFGKEVADLVKELTRYEPTAKEREGLSKEEVWRLRADILLSEIEKMSDRAKTIKLADRISNIEEAKRVKLGAKLERYVWQTQRFLDAIPRDVNPALWDELAAQISRPN